MIKKGLLIGAFACLAAAHAAAQSHPWPMAFADPARTQQSSVSGPNENATLEWRYVVPGPIPELVVDSNGNVTVGATFHEQWWSNEVFSTQISPEGKILWRKKMTPYVWGYSQGTGSGAALDSEGNIILPSSKSQLLKIAPAGTATWTIDGIDGAPNAVEVAVLADNSVRWMQGNHMHALNSSGVAIWSTVMYGRAFAVGVNGDSLVEYGKTSGSSTSTARVYLNADGSIRWSHREWRGGTGRMPVLGPDNTFYHGPRAIRSTDGATVWQDPQPVDNFVNALGKNGQMYTIGTSIRAYNKDTGAVLWTTPMPGKPVIHVAIDARNIIYATLDNGKILAVAPGGAILWEKQICDEFLSGPVLGTDGRLLAYGKTKSRRFIYCIK